MDRETAFGRLLAIANVLGDRVLDSGSPRISEKYMDKFHRRPFETFVKIHEELMQHAHKFGEEEIRLIDLFGEILSSIDEKDASNESLRPTYLQAYYTEQNFLRNGIMGTEEAAKLWGLSPDYIKRLCREGKVEARLIGKTWILTKNQPNPAQPDHPKNWRGNKNRKDGC